MASEPQAGPTRLLPRSTGSYALLAGLLLILALGLLYPIFLTVRVAFAQDIALGTGFTLQHLKMVFVDPVLVGGLVNAFKIAAATTTLCLIVSLPLAICSAKYRYPFKGVFNALILVPLILPPFVGAIGMQMLLGREGALNTGLDALGMSLGIDLLGRAKFWGVVIVEALHLYPIIYLNATAALANLDPALDEAAENLGCGPWRRFFKITLPLIRPGLFAGATIVFIWSFTELGTPLVFDYTHVTPVQIFHGLKEVQTSAQPYALTVVLLTAAIGMYAVGKLAFGGKAYAMYAKASRAGGEITLPRWAGWSITGAFALVTVLALLPHIGVILTSVTAPGQWYRSVLPSEFTASNFQIALSGDVPFNAIQNSLKLSAAAVAMDLVIGLTVAYIIVRTKIRGRSLLDTLCMLPLAVPGLVMAFGYAAMTLKWPFREGSGPVLEAPPFSSGGFKLGAFCWIAIILGGFAWRLYATRRHARSPVAWVSLVLGAGILAAIGPLFMRHGIPNPLVGTMSVVGPTPNPIPLLIIAYAIRRLPYIVRAAVAGLEQTSGELEEAAMNLGANRLTAVRKVIIPLIAANLIAGALLAFSFSMLEVSDSLVLAQQQKHYPITKAIYSYLNRLRDGPYVASAMGVWGMALLGVTLIGASILIGKKLGSIFRV